MILDQPGRLNHLVIARGAAYGLLLGVPMALANVILADQDPKPKGLLNLTLFGLVGAFTLAGFVAGRESRSDAARHGALAGLLVYVAVQVVGILGRLDRGDGIAPVQIIILALLAASAGAGGALLSARAHPKPNKT